MSIRILIFGAYLMALPGLASAQDIDNPTCQQILMIDQETGDASVALFQSYVFRDWEALDKIPAPGQAPIAPILEAHVQEYGIAVQADCQANPGETLKGAAARIYINARIQLYGKLPP